MLARLKNKEMCNRLILEMRESGFDYGRVEITMSSLDKTLARRRISEIASSQGKIPEEVVIDVLVASEGRVITSIEVLSERNVVNALIHPLSIVASNGSGYGVDHAKSGEKVHPRSFGAFTKVLEKYVKKEGLLSWEDAIYKMTGLPATRFGIKKRGKLQEGNFADILVIDPDRIESPATAENPYQYSKGVDTVLVNGKIILNEGELNSQKSGIVIKS